MVIVLSALFCLATFIMAVVALSIPYWRSADFISQNPATVGSFNMGLFRACVNDNINNRQLCHDRSDFKTVCNKSGFGSCDSWINRSWVIVTTMIIAAAANLIGVSVAVMGACCVVPLSQPATRVAVAFLALLSLVAWICFAISVGNANDVSFNVFEPVVKEMLVEMGSTTNSSIVNIGDFHKDHSANLTAASLALQVFLFAMMSFGILCANPDSHLMKDCSSFAHPRG